MQDAPLKSEEVESHDEEDYVEESEVVPRDRSLPSYIKKEKPIIRYRIGKPEEKGIG